MAQRVQVPGLGMAEFPDDMSHEQMVSAIQKTLSSQKTSGQPQKTTGQPAEPDQSMAKFAIQNTARGVSGIAGLPGQTVKNVYDLMKAGYGTYQTARGHPEKAPVIGENRDFPMTPEWLEQKLKFTDHNADPRGTAQRYMAAGLQGAPMALLGGGPGGAAKGALSGMSAEAASQMFPDSSIAPVIGSLLPEVPRAMTGAYNRSAEAANQRKQQNAIKDNSVRYLRQQGYSFQPTYANPESTVNKVLEGIAGKIKVQQKTSLKNQPVTNRLAASDLGINQNEITEQALRDVRTEAGQHYEAIRSLGTRPSIRYDPQYVADVKAIMGQDPYLQKANRQVPQYIQDIKDVMLGKISKSGIRRNAISPDQVITDIKDLRGSARKYSQGEYTPDNLARANAYRSSADALEELLDRHLTAAGHDDLLENYRNARQRLAKASDVEKVLNTSTGDVNAQKIASSKNKSAMTGGLKSIAQMGSLDRSGVQPPASMGSIPSLSPLDASAAMIAGASGGAKGGAMLGLRPMTANLLLSDFYQNHMLTPNYSGNPIYGLSRMANKNTLPVIPKPPKKKKKSDDEDSSD